MWLMVNINKYLDNVIGRGLRLNKQALAQTIPYIVESEFPDLTVLHLTNGLVVLEDRGGNRWKVCCANGKRFDIAPSFTKGTCRNKQGLTVLEHLEDKYYGFLFVDFTDTTTIKLSFNKLIDLDIREDGIVDL